MTCFMPFAKVNGIDLRYEVYGRGPAVMFGGTIKKCVNEEGGVAFRLEA